MTWFDQGQTRVYYEESGAGDPVLVLPGWGGTTDELVPLREALATKFRVIAADLPGSASPAHSRVLIGLRTTRTTPACFSQC